MDLEFQRKGELLVAKICWAPKPEKYQSKVTDWMFHWKLRLNASITAICRRYAFGSRKSGSHGLRFLRLLSDR